MAKSSKKTASLAEFLENDDELLSLDGLDAFFDTDQPEAWDIMDDGDRGFWDEFFQLENVLSNSDEFDQPSFTVTLQNHETGDVKTYSNIHLKSGKKKIIC